MPMKDLRAVYGDKKAPLVINAAIRAELPGGGVVLDTLYKATQMLYRASADEKPTVSFFVNRLAEIKQAMVSEILRRYNIEEASDGRQTDEGRAGDDGPCSQGGPGAFAPKIS